MKASDILDFDDLKTKTVHVKWWDRDVTIKELGLQDGLNLMMMSDKDGNVSLKAEDVAKIVAVSVIDDEGERVFSDKDIKQLAKKNMKALMFLYAEIVSLSGEPEVKN